MLTSNVLQHPHSAQFVLFGAMGDLAWRLIGPALFNLYLDKQLPPQFSLLGIDRTINVEDFRARWRDGVSQFSRRGAPSDTDWQAFAERIAAHAMDLNDSSHYSVLKNKLNSNVDKAADKADAQVFYLAIPPSLFSAVADGLASAGLNRDRSRTRIVVEKPLGDSLAAFQEIDRTLRAHFEEGQIYRMDHFLGKETVQNILAMRFANPIFEPIWNRRYIDHVAITVAEDIGVGHRAGYYEHAGALRDMVQNHLLQIMCLVAMEPPVAYDADDVRNKKLDVLRACRPIPADKVSAFAVRGQYGKGWIEGEAVSAYREEENIDANSNVETYAAVKLLVDNWRWQDVPFYLRTGKRMAAAVSEISIRFRDIPHNAFPAATGLNSQPVRLVIQMQPEQGIILKFMAKEPGSPLRLRPVNMRFSYSEAFNKPIPGAYETLLRDVLLGDATLFMRSDQVEAAWTLLMPVLDAWAANPAPDFPNYPAGSWGPEAAERLVAADGSAWLTPSQAASHATLDGSSHE